MAHLQAILKGDSVAGIQNEQEKIPKSSTYNHINCRKSFKTIREALRPGHSLRTNGSQH